MSARLGKAGHYSLSASTPSSLFSCFCTWQLQFCFSPAASFSFHLLQGPSIKPKRHLHESKVPRLWACLCVITSMCLYVYAGLCVCLPHALLMSSEARESVRSWDLDLQAAVSHILWVPGTPVLWRNSQEQPLSHLSSRTLRFVGTPFTQVCAHTKNE